MPSTACSRVGPVPVAVPHYYHDHAPFHADATTQSSNSFTLIPVDTTKTAFLIMDGAGPPLTTPIATSDPSNPTSPVESFADGFPPPTDHHSTSPRPQTHPAYPGASVYTPTDIPSERLNPRSCVTCRRRKVRCDKHMPCSNCRRAQIPCIFPAPGRAPRRPRPKDPNAPPKQPSSEREIELMKRLRKLEGIVEELSGQIEVETARNQSSTGNSPEATVHNGNDANNNAPGNGPRAERADSITAHSQGSPSTPGDARTMSPYNFNASSSKLLQRQDSVNKKFGRLVINDHGKTRYVSSAFWSKITDELDEIRNQSRRLTDGESEDSDDDESVIAVANQHSIGDHHAFVFGYRSADVDLRSLHPLPSQIPYMWQLYQENVDPIVKVIHVPTVDKLIKETRKNLDSLTPPNEALMFAIYYAAITSIDDADVKTNFGVEKSKLTSQYRFALEQALAKAEFLVSPELVVLQAFILFLVLVRRHDDTRFSWTLTGLAIRMGQSMGLHRDGTSFPGLTPLEIELRRRVFWALCILDLRSAEDQGTDLTIVSQTYDTEFPLNINDADISEDSKELPQPRQGATEMTFSLVRYEICSLARRLHTMSSALAASCPRDAASSFEERESMLKTIYESVESKYFKDQATSCNPILWTAANIARVIVAKMTLIIYQPMLFPGPNGEVLSDEIRERLFAAATEIFEYNHQLNSDPRSKQWRWLFQTYTQWHAVAYVLMEISRRPWTPGVERAWAALNSIFASPQPDDLDRIVGDQSVWLPLKKLYLKAKKHREAEVLRLKSDPNAAQKLELQERSKAPVPLSFAAMPGSVKSAIATERWRKLVNAPRLPPESQLPPQAALKQDAQPGGPMNPALQTSNVNTGGPLNNPNLQDPRTMDLVENALSQPQFMADNLWPLAFTPDFQDLGRAPGNVGNFALMNSEMPRQDAALSNYSPSQQQGGAGRQGPGTSMGADSRMQATPLLDALKAEGNVPVWMWNDPSTTGMFGGAPTGSVGPGNSGGPSMTATPPTRSFTFPMAGGTAEVMQPEDIDVDMNEDFNWADWGQSLMENGGSMGGVWSAHGI